MTTTAATMTAGGFPNIDCDAGAEPRLRGHRIRVRDIATARDQGGCSPEEIAATVYPGLTLGEVYSALAYYEDHRSEIDCAADSEVRTVADFQRQFRNLVGQITAPKN